LKEVQDKIKGYEYILSGERTEYEVVVEELNAIKKLYKEPRRTKLINATEEAAAVPITDFNAKQEREGRFCLLADDTVKLLPERNWQQVSESAKGNTFNDTIKRSFDANNTHNVAAFTNLGNFVYINIDDMDEARIKSKGLPLEKFCKEAKKNEFIVAAFDIKSLVDKYILFYTSDGKVKRTAASEYLGSRLKYYNAVVLSDDASLLAAEVEDEGASLLFVSRAGMILNFETDDIPLQGKKSSGVKGMVLDADDSIVFAGQTDNEGEIVAVTTAGFGKRVIIGTIEQMKRARKGLQLHKAEERFGDLIFAGIVKYPYDIVIFAPDGESFAINTEDIAIATSRYNKPENLLRHAPISEVGLVCSHIVE
jgi:DNA gyrase/topoisomerase IV subunit A